MPVPTSGFSARSSRDRLTLHVRAHQGAVGVVVLEEGISDAATETICFGETSMYSTSGRATSW